MAMNKQRKTSNIANIFSYDDAGNIVIKDYGQVTRYSWNGLIHGFVGPLSVSSVSAATTDTDRFLVSDGGVLKYRTGVELLSDIGGVPSTRTLTINGTTQDLSADRSFTIPSNNIYNSDGTLTGNRIVTVDDKQLVFRSNPSTLQNYTFTIGTPTGVPPSTWPASVVFEGEYLMNTANSEPYNTRVWGRNQSASARSFYVNQVFADITSESTGGTNMYNQLFLTRRGSPLDTSTTATSFMRGVWSEIGHRYGGASATLATITTTNQDAYYASNINNTGNITNAIGYYAQNQTGYAGTPYTTNITNYYGFYQFTILQDSKSTITNHYGVFLNTPTIATGGIITNRWGIYAPDIASRHYFNGNVLLGTTTDAGFKLDVNGTARVSGKSFFGNGTSYIYSSFQSVVNTSSSSSAYFEVSGAASNTSAMLFTKAGSLSTMWNLGTDASNDFYIFRHGINRDLFKVFDSSTNVGIDNIGAMTDIASAKLFVNSTTKGFLAPRMTTVERDAIVTPATGLQIYNTTTLQQNIYNGTSWVGTGSVSGSGADGQVAYWNGTNSQTGSNNLFWDAANSRLGIGSNTPTTPLYIRFPDNTEVGYATFYANNLTAGVGITWAGITAMGSGQLLKLTGNGTNGVNLNAGTNLLAQNGALYAAGTSFCAAYNGSGVSDLYFNYYGYLGGTTQFRNAVFANGKATDIMRLYGSTGNLVLQNGGTFTDGGQRLQVYGDAFIKGSGATSATAALSIQNSAGTALFSIDNAGTNVVTNLQNFYLISSGNTAKKAIKPYWGSDVMYGLDIFGNDTSLNATNPTPNGYLVNIGSAFSIPTTTNTDIDNVRISLATFNPTSGTTRVNMMRIGGAIAQTGGANGITRGLYVNPTLTAAADWRSIEWSNNSGWGLYGAGTAPNFLGGNTTINGTLQVGTTNTWETYIYSRTSISGILLRANYGVAAQMDLTFDVNGVLNMTGVVGFSTANVIGTTTLQTNGNVQLNGNNKAVYWVNVTDQFIVGMSGQNYVIRANSGSLTSGGSLVSTSFFTGNTTFGGSVDAGYKIDVQGTSRFSDKLSVIATATTNDVALFRSVEPYITIEAVGASNPASIFFRPSTSAQNATIQNRTGGGIDLYTGITPSLSLAIKSSGAVVTSSTLGLNGVEDSVKSGKYTPTLTNSTNVASSAVNDNVFKYIRVGSTVHVSGWVTITATASNTLTELELSLPIASNITSNEDVSGVANTLSGGYGQVRENATNNTAKMYVQPTSTSNLVWYLEFSYVII